MAEKDPFLKVLFPNVSFDPCGLIYIPCNCHAFDALRGMSMEAKRHRRPKSRLLGMNTRSSRAVHKITGVYNGNNIRSMSV